MGPAATTIAITPLIAKQKPCGVQLKISHVKITVMGHVFVERKVDVVVEVLWKL